MNLINILKTIFSTITMVSTLVTFADFVIIIAATFIFTIILVIIMTTIVFDLSLSPETISVMSYISTNSLKVAFIGLISIIPLYMLTYLLMEIDKNISK